MQRVYENGGLAAAVSAFDFRGVQGVTVNVTALLQTPF